MAISSKATILCDVCGNPKRSTTTWELILQGETRYVVTCREHEKTPLITLWNRYAMQGQQDGRRARAWTMEEIEALKKQKSPRP